jgi:hypothetical protein
MRQRRILVLRSGRHLDVAVHALAARYPGCHVGVVGTAGSAAALAQAGIAPEDSFLYPAPRFQSLGFPLSSAARAARKWRYDEVAILWSDAQGSGQGNVNRMALTLSLRGYLAVTPDGTVLHRPLWSQVRAECVRIVTSAVVAVRVVAVVLYAPVHLFAAIARTSSTMGTVVAPFRVVLTALRRAVDQVLLDDKVSGAR